MHRSIEGVAEFSLGGTELGALLVCETDVGGTPATIAGRYQSDSQPSYGGDPMRGNFAVAIADRVSEVRWHR
jgi:hypothetical protein